MNNFPQIQDLLLYTLQKLVAQFSDFVPKLIGAAILLLVGITIAKILAWATEKVLGKIGIDKLGDKLNQIDFVRGLGTEIKLSKIASKTLYYFVLLVFVTTATETLGMKAITDIVAKLVAFVPNVLAAGILLLVGVLVADLLKSTVVGVCKSLKIASGRLLGNVVFGFFLVLSLIAALGQAGINTALLESSFIILLGGIVVAFAVGYGSASKDVLANFLSAFYSKGRFQEGQIIAINGIKGKIIAIDSTSVTLEAEHSKTIFPLSLLQNQQVEIFES